MSRPIWQRIVDPDEPLLWARRLAFIAIGLSVASILIAVFV